MTKFGYYQYKHSLKEEDEWKQVCLFPKTKARVISDAPVIPYLPVQNRALKKKKVDGELLRFVPLPYQLFYTDIIACEDSDSDNEDDDE